VLAFRGVSQNSLRSNSCEPWSAKCCAPRRSQRGFDTGRAVASLGPGTTNSRSLRLCSCSCSCSCSWWLWPWPWWWWWWWWWWWAHPHLYERTRMRSCKDQRHDQSPPQQARSACCGPLAERSDGP